MFAALVLLLARELGEVRANVAHQAPVPNWGNSQLGSDIPPGAPRGSNLGNDIIKDKDVMMNSTRMTNDIPDIVTTPSPSPDTFECSTGECWPMRRCVDCEKLRPCPGENR